MTLPEIAARPDFPADFRDLKGKSVFITGGGSGIGAALTEAFIAQGAMEYESMRLRPAWS